jgi:hypothetical protein
MEMSLKYMSAALAILSIVLHVYRLQSFSKVTIKLILQMDETSTDREK